MFASFLGLVDSSTGSSTSDLCICRSNFMLQLLIADIIKVSVSVTISTVASSDALK